jgi:2-oxoglutarate dehydrogenase complex dehydrogenase (E1) component-like enzyme
VEEAASDALRAAMLIRTYRVRGHLPPISTRSA